MAEQSRLIIISNREILYRGDGTLLEWKKRLGKEPTEKYYHLTQLRKISYSGELEITNCEFIKVFGGDYMAQGNNVTICPLDAQSKSMLVDFINSIPEPEAR